MIVIRWTGVEVRALRTQALRRTQSEFADLIGYSEAVVRKWEGRGETITLAGQFAAAMDTLLRRLDDEQSERFRRALPADSTVSAPVTDRSAAVVASRLPELRRVLDAYDLVDDGPVRAIEQLRDAVTAVVSDRLNSNYTRLAYALPDLLSELLRARSICSGSQLADIDRLLVQGYRAADAIAVKYGHYDLSARIIGMMHDSAMSASDELVLAATAYVRTETFFVSGELTAGRKLLERAAEAVDPASSTPAAATYGSLHMRAGVAAARGYFAADARAHLNEAARVARLVPEGVYFGTAFGPSSVRIHQVSLGVELGDPGSALAAAQDWVPTGSIPAERRSHYFIDMARAHLQANHRDDAHAALKSAQLVAPEHTNSHPQVKEMLARLAADQPV
ncbi:hypothetical protein D5S18_06595 [Nocardia panacis]|uniref:XRE family transcriptional regulator n=2 Tax=Nocardia panacis TaxID=2340916 RepID=A0A3A4KSS6_9NOCA|nr:hypothetical protein D5S18_06595 [Nocardia panacis]